MRGGKTIRKSIAVFLALELAASGLVSAAAGQIDPAPRMTEASAKGGVAQERLCSHLLALPPIIGQNLKDNNGRLPAAQVAFATLLSEIGREEPSREKLVAIFLAAKALTDPAWGSREMPSALVSSIINVRRSGRPMGADAISALKSLEPLVRPASPPAPSKLRGLIPWLKPDNLDPGSRKQLQSLFKALLKEGLSDKSVLALLDRSFSGSDSPLDNSDAVMPPDAVTKPSSSIVQLGPSAPREKTAPREVPAPPVLNESQQTAPEESPLPSPGFRNSAQESSFLAQQAELLANSNSSPESAIKSFHILSEALDQRPQSAAWEMERALWSGIAAFRAHMNQLQKDEHAIEDAAVVKVGGRYFPIRRVRDLFELYQKLMSVRPDLAPSDITGRIRDGLSMEPIRNYQRQYLMHRYTDPYWQTIWSIDKKGSQVALWSLNQTAGLAFVLNKKRPDLLGLEDLLSYHDLIQKRHNTNQENVNLLVAALIFAAFPLTAIAANIFANPILCGAVFLVPIAAAILVHTMLRNDALRELERSLFQSAIARAKTLRPHAVVKIIASFDAKRGRWVPEESHKALFKALWKSWPEFQKEALGENLQDNVRDNLGNVKSRYVGTMQDYGEGYRRAVAMAATDPSNPEDEALGYALWLAQDKKLYVHESRLPHDYHGYHGDLEPLLRREFFDAHNPTSLLRQDLKSHGLSRRLRILSDIYFTILRLGPRVAGQALEALKAVSLQGPFPESLDLARKWRARIVDAADQTPYGHVSLSEALFLYNESGSKDPVLEGLLLRAARRSAPQQVLDAIGEPDAERIFWFPKAGYEKIFKKLKRDWPEFRKAALGKDGSALEEKIEAIWLPAGQRLLDKWDRYIRKTVQNEFAAGPMKEAVEFDPVKHSYATPVSDKRFTVIWELGEDKGHKIAYVRAVLPIHFTSQDKEQIEKQVAYVLEIESKR